MGFKIGFDFQRIRCHNTFKGTQTSIMSSNESNTVLWFNVKFMEFYDSVNNCKIQVCIDGNIPEEVNNDQIFTRFCIKIVNQTNKQIVYDVDCGELNRINNWITEVRQYKYNTTSPPYKKLNLQKYKFNSKKSLTMDIANNNNVISTILSITENNTETASVVLDSHGSNFLFSSILNIYENYSTILMDMSNSLLNKKSLNFLNKEVIERLLKIESSLNNINYKNIKKEKDIRTMADIVDLDNAAGLILNEAQNKFEKELDLDNVKLEGEENFNKPIKETIEISSRPFIGRFLKSDISNLNKWVDAFALADDSSNPLIFAPINTILNKIYVSKNDKLDNLLKHKDYLVSQYYIIDNLKRLYKSIANEEKTPDLNKYFSILNMLPFKSYVDFITDVTYLNIVYKILDFRKSKLNKIEFSKLDSVHLQNRTFLKIISSIFNINMTELQQQTLRQNVINLHSNLDKQVLEPLELYFSEISAGSRLNISLDSIEKMFDNYIKQLSKITSNVNYTEDLNSIYPNLELNSIEDIQKMYKKEKIKKLEEPPVKKESVKELPREESKKKDAFDLEEDGDDSFESLLKAFTANE